MFTTKRLEKIKMEPKKILGNLFGTSEKKTFLYVPDTTKCSY